MMESIKKINKRALNFLRCVQTACNNHRMMIEDVYKREYSNFVNHWKKSEDLIFEELQSVQETSLSTNIEELCLADNLLQRARHVRMNLEKSKFPTGSRIVLGDHKPSCDKMSKILTRKKIRCQNVVFDSGKLTGIDVEHKSINLNSSAVQYKHTYSKKKSTSSKIIGLKLPNQTVKSVSRQKCFAASIPSSSDENRHKSPSSVIVSEKELSSYKTMHLTNHHLFSTYNSNEKEVGAACDQREQSTLSLKYPLPSVEMSCKTASPDNKVLMRIPVSLDCQYMPNHVLTMCGRKQPTDKNFRAVLKNSVNETKAFQPHIRWFWYPFLNTANESSLRQDIKCDSIHELETVYVWIHKIQETMLWLDFITLLHKEINPYIQQLDQIDRVTLTVICNIHKILS